MRRLALSTLIGLVILIGCAAIVSGRDAPPKSTHPDLSAEQDADSVRLRGTWSAVLDARGQAVVRYAWTMRRNGVAIDSGSVTTTVVQRTYANPLAGDSAVYRLSVVAIDVRDARSAPGQSPNVVVHSPWVAPPAPVVGLDTLASAPPPSLDVDSISLVVVMEDGRVTQNPVFTRAGETAQGCVLEWIGRTPRLAAGQPAECNAVAVMLGLQPDAHRRLASRSS